MTNFKKYQHSRVTREQLRQVASKYLGKRGKVYFPLLKKKVWARERRWCDLPYQKVVDATIDLVRCEMEFMDMHVAQKLHKDVCDHWADIMADWVSESECDPILKK